MQASLGLLLYGHPLILLLLAGPKAVRGRFLHLLRLPPQRGEYVISNFASSLFFLIHRIILWLTPYACLLISLLVVSSFLQFKHNEDTSITRPILLDKPEFEVCYFLLHVFLLSCVIMCPISFSPFFFFFCIYIYIYICITTYHALFSSAPYILFCVLQADPKPISIYHPTTKEVSAAMGTLMEGFFDRVDVVAEAMASASIAAQGAPTETPIPSAEPSPIKEDAQTERISESAFIPIETPTPQKGVTPAATSQTESASPSTPLVISTSDPFVALSQAVKDGYSLVVTPSSIPSSTTRGPDEDLSSDKGSEEVLEDFDDKPTMKKRVSDSDEKDCGEHETEVIGMYSLHLLGFLSHPFSFFFF